MSTIARNARNAANLEMLLSSIAVQSYSNLSESPLSFAIDLITNLSVAWACPELLKCLIRVAYGDKDAFDESVDGILHAWPFGFEELKPM